MGACSVDGCDRPTQCRGMCSTHYKRWWRTHPADVDHWPPIPDGLTALVTARLHAVHDGSDAEHEASSRLRDLIDTLT